MTRKPLKPEECAIAGSVQVAKLVSAKEDPAKKPYNFAKKTGCTIEDLWWAYSTIKDPFTLGDVGKLLEKEKTIKVSVPWLHRMIKRYKFEDKRRFLFVS